MHSPLILNVLVQTGIINVNPSKRVKSIEAVIPVETIDMLLCHVPMEDRIISTRHVSKRFKRATLESLRRELKESIMQLYGLHDPDPDAEASMLFRWLLPSTALEQWSGDIVCSDPEVLSHYKVDEVDNLGTHLPSRFSLVCLGKGSCRWRRFILNTTDHVTYRHEKIGLVFVNGGEFNLWPKTLIFPSELVWAMIAGLNMI
jgi:hypothetical protein